MSNEKFKKTMTNKDRFNKGRENAIAAIQNTCARLGIRMSNASETVIFSEQGYKITVYIGDTSGHVNLIRPDGTRSPMDSAPEARKTILKELKESGYHAKGEGDPTEPPKKR